MQPGEIAGGAGSSDPVLDVVEWLAGTAGVGFDRTVARRALRELFVEHREAVGQEQRIGLVTEVCARLGVALRQVGRRLAAGVPEHLPAAALWNGRCAFVEDGPGHMLRVRVDGGPAEQKTPAELYEALGAGADDEVVFLLAVPAAPLEALRGHDHQHGAHAHHEHPSPFARLFRLASMERRDIAIAMVYAAGYGLMGLVVPVAVETLVGTVAFGSLMQPVISLMVLLAAGLVMAAVMRAYHVYVVELMQRRIFVRSAVDAAHRMSRVSLERFEHGAPAELVNRFFDAITVQKSAGTLLVDGVSIVLSAVLGMVLLAFYHPFLLAFDVLLVGGIVFVLVVLGRGATNAFVETSKAKFEVAAWLEEIARHPVTFKSAGWTRYATERAQDLVRRYLHHRSERFRILLRQIIGSYGLQVFANTALLGIGGFLVIERQLTIGQLVASNLVVAMVLDGFTKLGKQIEAFYDMVAGLDKLGYLTDVPLERGGGGPAPSARGPARVELQRLGYQPGGRTILDGVDLTLEPGSHTLLLAPEGSGKTVLAELLFGLREPTSGVIRIDGVDTRSLSLEALRSMVSLARDVEVFDGTIAENVSGGSPLCDPARIREALDAVGLSREIEALPQGTNTLIRDGKGPLSSGQRTRLSLARSMAAAPRLLVVDEAIETLDEDRRTAVLTALRAPGAPWTLLVLSNNEAMTPLFPRVLRLERGRVVPQVVGRAA